MVRSNVRRRPDRGNFNIHSHRAMRINKLGLQLQRKMAWKVCICPAAKNKITDWKCCQCSEWVCKNHSDSSSNMQQLQGTVIIQTNFIFISVLNYILLWSKVLLISFYIVAWEKKNLNNSSLFVLESKKQNWQKENIKKVI